MQTVNELLDAIKARHGISSDYKLAQYLGLTSGAIAHYRHARSMPDELACVRIAKALDMDGEVLAAQVQAERARDDESRAFWQRVAVRLQGGVVHSALLACLVALGFMTTPPNASAAVTDLQSADSGGSVYYVNIKMGSAQGAPACHQLSDGSKFSPLCGSKTILRSSQTTQIRELALICLPANSTARQSDCRGPRANFPAA